MEGLFTVRAVRLCGALGVVYHSHPSLARHKAALGCAIPLLAYPHTKDFSGHGEIPRPLVMCILCACPRGLRCAALTRRAPWEGVTLVDFFTDSALLSLLEVLAALGELRPLERTSSAMGEARPSGLAACFFLPLRRVDICGENTAGSALPSLPECSALAGARITHPCKSPTAKTWSISRCYTSSFKAQLDSNVKGGKPLICLLKNIKC